MSLIQVEFNNFLKIVIAHTTFQLHKIFSFSNCLLYRRDSLIYLIIFTICDSQLLKFQSLYSGLINHANEQVGVFQKIQI